MTAEADERQKNRIQESEDRIQKTASIKVKTINKSKSTPSKAKKHFLMLFDLDLLDLKPCPAGRYDVYLLINCGNYTKFQGKVNEKVTVVSGSQPPEAVIIEN